MEFKLQSPFEPAGDQPQAIEQLVEGLKTGKREQVLMAPGKPPMASASWLTSSGAAFRRWKAIRCADLGPTPGRRRSSSMRRSRGAG